MSASEAVGDHHNHANRTVTLVIHRMVGTTFRSESAFVCETRSNGAADSRVLCLQDMKQ